MYQVIQKHVMLYRYMKNYTEFDIRQLYALIDITVMTSYKGFMHKTNLSRSIQYPEKSNILNLTHFRVRFVYQSNHYRSGHTQ